MSPAVTKVVIAAALGLSVTGCGLLGDGDSGGNQGAFCAVVSDIERFKDTFGSFDPLDVPTALATFSQAREEQHSIRDLAPNAIRPDFDTQITYLDDLVEGLESADPDNGGRPAIYDDLRTRVAEVEAASARIEQYVKANCEPTDPA